MLDTGHYTPAEPLYRRALQIGERVHGPDHPETGTSLNNLAYLLSDQGRYEEAEPLFRRALQIAEQALGPAHPDTGTYLNNLAGLLESQVLRFFLSPGRFLRFLGRRFEPRRQLVVFLNRADQPASRVFYRTASRVASGFQLQLPL